MQVLAGDIGGTKTALAIFEIGEERLSVLREERFASADFASLEEVVERFLEGRRPPRRAGFGVAGPVRAGRARVTKLPWTIEARRLAQTLGAGVVLVNDFVAAAFGIPYLRPRHLRLLSRGKPERGGPLALLGAGTGLGQAGLVRISGRYEPIASEGGHADFGARDAREDRLNAFVRARFGRTTGDRLLSGEGLRHIYEFLREDRFAPESPEVAAAFLREDPAAVISRFGLEQTDRLCGETLSRFVSIYGSEAGNVALRFRATGGVFIGGGIAPRILPALERGDFLQAFRAKPPMDQLLANVPVRVVLEPRLGLFGAAVAAYRTAMETTRPFSKRMERRATR